jgi:hypothetical protein
MQLVNWLCYRVVPVAANGERLADVQEFRGSSAPVSYSKA